MEFSEIKAALDERDQAMLAKLAATDEQFAGVLARMHEIEQKAVREGGSYSGPTTKSLGAQVAASERYKAFVLDGAKGAVRIQTKDLTSATGSAGAMIPVDVRPEVVGLPRTRMTVRSLLAQGRTTSNLVQYPRQTGFTNNAGVVSEGAEKPESEITIEEADSPVRTIAHWIHVSRQAMDDAPQLQSLIDSDLRYGLALAEETELLYGDGTGQHIDGLVSNATAYSAPFTPSLPTMLDAVLAGIAQVEQSKYPATGIIVNDLDWRIMQSIKDTEGRYIGGGPFSQAPATMWNIPVVFTPAMTRDKFLVGNFTMAAQIFDRMDVEVLISSEDRDNFVKNMLTVRAEQRLALAIKRPEAIVYGDFGNVT
jgi:HK97 family phage major capsid protein